MSKRFFINKPLKENNTIEISGENYNYVINVMRKRVGDQIIVCNNTSYDFLCELKEVNKSTAKIEVLNKNKNQNEANTKVTLFQALVKNDKLELIMQKITELGLSELTAFESQFTVVKQKTNKLERLTKIAENASRQCGRANTVKINEVQKLKNLPNLLKDYDLTILAYEKGGKSLKTIFNNKPYANLAIIVGSEGGFSAEEVEFLKNEVKNLVVVGLGKRILRAETASIALSTLVMHELGELE